MSDDRVRSFELTVDGGPNSEVFVVDSAFHLVARDVGRVTRPLAAGVYKAKARRGREEVERIFVHDHDETVDLRPAPLASPAPINASGRVHEWHESAAEQTSSGVHVRLGAGAQIFLLSRYWTAPNRAQTVAPGHPGEGLTLRSAAGRVLVDYEHQGELTADARDPVVGCTAELDPGTYFVNRLGRDGRTLVQSIVASAGWQTQVFVLRDPIRGSGPGPGDSADLQRELHPDSVSVMIGRGPFDGQAPDLATTEVARLALADERRIMSPDLMSIIESSPNNPMLGILGGHLLILSLDRAAGDAQTDRSDSLRFSLSPTFLDGIVDRLRSSLGSDHPDVEALSLRCVDSRARTRRPLSSPPMLRPSWSLYVVGSADLREIVPYPIWKRIRQLVVAPPYLTWRRSTEARRDPAMALVRSIRRRTALADRNATRSERHTVRARLVPGPHRHQREFAEAALGPVPQTALETLAAIRVQPHPFAELHALSIANDIPMNVIDDAIRRA